MPPLDVARYPRAAMDALVIVDLQRVFDPPAELVARIRARADQFPLCIFTRFVNPPNSLVRRKLNRQSCAPGNPDGELVISPKPGDLVIEKFGYGFDALALRRLREAGVRHVLVCGGDTDACVLGVVFSLFDAGIDCSVDPSLCWSSAGLHDEAMKVIAQQFGTPADLGSARG
jgi:nicotinamidase-related amidase